MTDLDYNNIGIDPLNLMGSESMSCYEKQNSNSSLIGCAKNTRIKMTEAFNDIEVLKREYYTIATTVNNLHDKLEAIEDMLSELINNPTGDNS